MIVVRVELHSAIDGSVTELARAIIANVGGTEKRRNYAATVFRGRSTADLDKRVELRSCSISNWPSPTVHVWNLVATVLNKMTYGDKR